jgi:hypothetical protein
LQRSRKTKRRLFANPASGYLLFADMDQASQKRAGRNYYGASGNRPAVRHFDTGNLVVPEHEVVGLGFDDL